MDKDFYRIGRVKISLTDENLSIINGSLNEYIYV